MRHLIFFDGEETPTMRQPESCTWRPPRGDMSWRIEDENRRVIEEYHPRRGWDPDRLADLRRLTGADKHD